MDKRAKKRLDALRPKLQKLEQQLAGEKRQKDDLAEIARLEREIAAIRQEMARAQEG